MMSKAITELRPKSTDQRYIKDCPKGISPAQHYYRVIIGANVYRHNTKYLCYRKDPRYWFLVDTVDFNTRKINDLSFIFTQKDFEHLLDYLTAFDDRTLYTIAQIGKKEIDPISLLPII